MPKEKKPISRRAGSSSEGIGKPAHLAGKSWFLGIGINQYQTFAQLHNAVKDVEDLCDLLLQQYDLDAETVKILKNRDATRVGIIQCLDQLIDQVKSTDKLILYYSGHGYYDKKTARGYWIPSDAREGVTASYIRNSTIRDYLKDINSLHTLLISDSCFAGSLFVRGAVKSIQAVNELETLPSRWAVCSGRQTEAVLDGIPGQNSPFAACILDILQRNRNPALNVARLADQVVEKTSKNYKQLPEGKALFGVGDKGGQYVFRLKVNEVEDWLACRAQDDLEGYYAFLKKYPRGEYGLQAKEKIELLEEEVYWKETKETNTILAYYKYNQLYPAGRYFEHALECIENIEEDDSWKAAIERNKLSTYEKYLKDYPQGKYKEVAEEKIDQLINDQQEEELWKKARESKGVKEKKAYLKRFPLGKYAKVAREKIRTIEHLSEQERRHRHEERDWVRAKSAGTLQSFRIFLQAYPSSSHKEPALEAINRILAGNDIEELREQEEQAWDRAKESGRLSAFQGFVHSYPDSIHTIEAKEAIRRIQQESLDTFSLDENQTQLDTEVAVDVTLHKHPRAGKIERYEEYLERKEVDQDERQAKDIRMEGVGFRLRDRLTTAFSDDKVLAGMFICLFLMVTIIVLRKSNHSLEHVSQAVDKESMEPEDLRTSQIIGPNYLRLKPLPSIAFGHMQDPRDGKSYETIDIDGQTWLAEDLRYYIDEESSWCISEKFGHCESHGYFYNWEAARKACPTGWHLPTDQEWRTMAGLFGGVWGDAEDGGKGSFKALGQGGISGFNACLNGWRQISGEIEDYGTGGAYWTDTRISREYVWYYFFGGSAEVLYRYEGQMERGRLCRCIENN